MSTRKERRAKPRFSQGQGTTSFIGIRGRKTGITAKEFVVRDVDNLENVDDFFESSEESAQSEDDSFSFIRTFQQKYLPDASPQDNTSPLLSPLKQVSSKKSTPQTIEKPATSFSPLQPVPFNLDIPAPDDDEPEGESESQPQPEQGQSEIVEQSETKEKSKKKEPKKRKPKARAVVELEESPQNGHRRSKRTKIKPVEYWRNERVIYKFDDGLVPSVADVYHRPHTTPEPSTKQKTRIEKEIPKVHVKTKKGKVTKLLAKHKSMVDSKQRDKGKASVVEVFNEDSFVSGLFFLPPNADSNQTAEQTEVFYVINGKVHVTVHKGEMIGEEKEIELESGAHFFIPKDAEYTLVNPSKQQKCKLLFTSVK